MKKDNNILRKQSAPLFCMIYKREQARTLIFGTEFVFLVVYHANSYHEAISFKKQLCNTTTEWHKSSKKNEDGQYNII